MRDVMFVWVERQFEPNKVRCSIEWSSTMARRASLDMAAALGLRLCFTPVGRHSRTASQKPPSTPFKRDYARSPPDSATMNCSASDIGSRKVLERIGTKE